MLNKRLLLNILFNLVVISYSQIWVPYLKRAFLELWGGFSICFFMLVACVLAKKFICKHVYIINKHVRSWKIIVKKELQLKEFVNNGILFLIFLFFNLKNVKPINKEWWVKGIHYVSVILCIRVIFLELKW